MDGIGGAEPRRRGEVQPGLAPAAAGLARHRRVLSRRQQPHFGHAPPVQLLDALVLWMLGIEAMDD